MNIDWLIDELKQDITHYHLLRNGILALENTIESHMYNQQQFVKQKKVQI